MSVDTNINLGPYLLVTTKKQTTDEKVKTCPNKKCKKHGKEFDEKFCATCGAAVQICIVKRVTDLSPDEVLEEEFLDELVVQNCMGSPLNGLNKNQEVLTSNQHSPFDKKRKFDPDYGGITDLEDLNIQAEKDWFTKKYAEPIALLEKTYGKENVELRYGIVISHS